MLGTMLDKEVAARLGISIDSVFQKRHAMGIAAYTKAGKSERGQPRIGSGLARNQDFDLIKHGGIHADQIRMSRFVLAQFLAK
jgi:hypothetical protein